MPLHANLEPFESQSRERFVQAAAEARELINAVDPVDLAAAVGALLLLPANLHFFFRLEGLAHLSLAGAAQGSQKTTPEKLGRLCNHTLAHSIGHLDDPWELPSTVGFTFHGGTRVVIPGGVDTIYELRLLAGVLVESDALDSSLRASGTRLLQAAAKISDTVLKRAGLERNQRVPSQASKVSIPQSADLRRLKSLVQFEIGEFDALVRSAGARLHDVEQLIADIGAIELQPGPWESLHLTYRPLARSGSSIVLAAPHLLMQAAIRGVVNHAFKLGVSARLADALHNASVRSVSRSLEVLGLRRCSPVRMDSLPKRASLLSHQLWEFDNDKILHMVVASDGLSGSEDSARESWNISGLSDALVGVRAMAERTVAELDPQPKTLMTLFSCVGSGRDYALSLPVLPLGTPSALFFLGSDLETVVQADTNEADSLLLWKYACAHDLLAETTKILTASPLDLYGLWEARDKRFLGFDDSAYSFISVQPGAGAEGLRWKALERYDWHAVKHPRSSLIEVGRTERRRPIYWPRQMVRDQVELIVEGNKGTIWICSPVLTNREDRYERQLYSHVVRALAFWVSEFQTLLPESFDALGTRNASVLISVDLGPIEGWVGLRSDGPPPEGPGFGVRRDATSGLHVTVHPSFLSRYSDEDNTAEVELAAALVTNLLGMYGDAADAHALVQSVLAIAAPPGPKRMLHQINSQKQPELAVTNRLRARHLQQYDVGIAQLATVAQLGDKLGAPEGSWAGAVTNTALRAAVAGHFDALSRSVRTVDAAEALRHLIGRNEALLAERSKTRRTLASQLACNASDTRTVETLSAQLPAIAAASLSTRFLVELLSAEAPLGSQSMSVALFDQWLSIAAELISLGMASDVQHLALAEVEIELRPYGYRIGRGSYGEAAVEVQDAVVAQAVHDASTIHGEFDRATWNFPTTEQLDLAAAAEFGASISEIVRLLGSVSHLAIERGESVIDITTVELIAYLERELSWQEDKIRQVIDVLTLQPRETFLTPNLPHGPNDVLPWKFNRELSYLRRPLIRINRGEQRCLFGAGAPLASAEHLAEMCFEGRLKAKSTEMRQLMSQFTRAFGDVFNSQVAEAMKANGFDVRARVKKIGRNRIALNGNELGDVDVLAADPYKKRLWLLECKNFAAARVPQEVKADLDDLFVNNNKRLSVQSKHRKRIDWIEAHLRETLEWLDLPFRGRWSVSGALVFSRALISPLLGLATMPVWTLHDLETGNGPGRAVKRRG
jgi:hypothetical protein